jgi:hypothetical protein
LYIQLPYDHNHDGLKRHRYFGSIATVNRGHINNQEMTKAFGSMSFLYVRMSELRLAGKHKYPENTMNSHRSFKILQKMVSVDYTRM